ncbi:Myb- protein B [Entomophthora muscae]|uniref:Myb- protein B n=1 Tax=Entomophthora muscae TaxID=34485 RepID=A0ACC2T6J5_9FUNG|nr:Myb- protein B [Entomophthora muscae]
MKLHSLSRILINRRGISFACLIKKETCFLSEDLLGKKKAQVKWSPEMDDKLLKISSEAGDSTWKQLGSKYFPEFSPRQVYLRYYNISKTCRKGAWMEEEVKLLDLAVSKFGRNWTEVSKFVGTRNYLQCLQKWDRIASFEVSINPWSKTQSPLRKRPPLSKKLPKAAIDWKYLTDVLSARNNQQESPKQLSPSSLRRGAWTSEETFSLLVLVGRYSTDWQLVSRHLRSRSPNQCSKEWRALRKAAQDKPLSLCAIAGYLPRRSWSPVEDEVLLRMYRLLGNRWSLIVQSNSSLSTRSFRNAERRFSNLMKKTCQPWFTPLPPFL